MTNISPKAFNADQNVDTLFYTRSSKYITDISPKLFKVDQNLKTDMNVQKA